MDLQNVVNFIQRPRIVSQHPSDVALRMAEQRSGGRVRGTAGAFDPVSSYSPGTMASQPVAAPGTPTGGGMTTGQGLQLATTIASSLASIGVSIYSSQLQKDQAKRDAELQKQMLDVQKNQQSLEAYKLLSSSAGRDVANGVTAPQGGGDALNGGLVIAAGVGLLALMMLR